MHAAFGQERASCGPSARGLGKSNVGHSVELPMPRLIHDGPPISVDAAMGMHGLGDHGADEPEGVVYRVERKGRFDFMAKWVRPDKVDGKYLPDVSTSVVSEPVWNWRPK